MTAHQPTLTRFVGREADLAALEDLFRRGTRLVTVLGPPGMGKTRLAQQFAARQADSLFVDLTPCRDRTALLARLADALELDGPERADLIPSALLARGRLLLVLDNFEQITDVGAADVASWLNAPALRVLVTSRERLAVSGESLYELSPLDPTSEAVELFLDRARALLGAWEPDDRQREAITAIARRLDGIPLAIELAAARVRVLEPTALLERLTTRLDALGGGRRDATSRQRTLAGAVTWSWEILSDAERAAMAQCAVFEGSFDLELAEAVVETTEDPLDLIAALTDKSMLRRRSDGRGTRFSFYATILDYARARLDDRDDAEAVRERHAVAVVARGEQLADHTYGPGGITALADLTQLQADLILVASRSRGDEAVRAAIALDPLLSTRGPFDRYAALLDRVLTTEPGPLWRARGLFCRGNLHRLQGRSESAARDLELARTLAHDTGDQETETAATSALGITRHEQGRLDDAEQLHEAALTMARRGNGGPAIRRIEARALGSLAILRDEQARPDDAQVLYEQALTVFRQVGDQRSIAIFLSNLGDLHQEQGRSSEARTHYQQALEMVREIGDPRVEAVILGNLGGVHQDEGHLDLALSFRSRAVERLEAVGDRRLLGVFLGYRASVLLERGELGEALADLGRAIGYVRGAGDARYSGLFWCFQAIADVMGGELARARAALATAQEYLAGVGDPFLQAAATLHRAHLESPEAAARAMDAARSGPTGRSAAARSDDVRFALRMLARRLGDAAPAGPAERAALRVDEDGTGFTPPDGVTVDLSRRKNLRRLLLGLTTQRLAAPGLAMTVDEMLATGWPGEQIIPEAGTNRVYVAIATLRKLGLRDLLLSRDDGYLLDPETPVEYAG